MESINWLSINQVHSVPVKDQQVIIKLRILDEDTAAVWVESEDAKILSTESLIVSEQPDKNGYVKRATKIQDTFLIKRNRSYNIRYYYKDIMWIRACKIESGVEIFKL